MEMISIKPENNDAIWEITVKKKKGLNYYYRLIIHLKGEKKPQKELDQSNKYTTIIEWNKKAVKCNRLPDQ